MEAAPPIKANQCQSAPRRLGAVAMAAGRHVKQQKGKEKANRAKQEHVRWV